MMAHGWNDFDWIERDDEVVIRHQHQTAVFVNDEGSVVIRQWQWPQDDQAVIITAKNLPVLIARLQAAMAEVAAFERWEAEQHDDAMADRRDRARRLRVEIDSERPQPEPAKPLPPASAPAPLLFDDEWLKPIAEFLTDASKTTVADVAEGALHIEEPGTADQRRIAAILAALGWTPQRDKHGRWWQRGDSTKRVTSSNDVIVGVGDAVAGAGDSTTERNGVTNDAPASAACRVASPVKRSS